MYPFIGALVTRIGEIHYDNIGGNDLAAQCTAFFLYNINGYLES